MFLITWEPGAFDRMQELVTAHPDLRSEFGLALRTLAAELGRAADSWGESREGRDRLGFAGALMVLVRIDPDDRVASIVDVALRAGRRPD